MSRNTSPQSRSTSGPRGHVTSAPQARSKQSRARASKQQGTGSAARIARRAGSEAKARRRNEPTTLGGRIRRVGLVVGIPYIAVVLTIVAVAFGIIMLTSTPMAWLPTAVATSWMVTALAPVTAADVSIAAVPGLPGLVLSILVAMRIRKAFAVKVSIKDLLICLGWVIALPLILTLVAWIMLWDAGKVYDVAPPSLLHALPRVLLMSLAAMVMGMGPRLWRALAKRYKVPKWVPRAGAAAAKMLMWFAGAAAVLVFILGLFSIPRQQELLALYPNLDGLGVAALFALTVAYLPNAVVAMMGVLSGSAVAVGDGWASLFSVHNVALPPLPLMGLLPGHVYSWGPALMVETIAVFIAALWRVRPTFVQGIVVGAFGIVYMAVLAYLSGGEVGVYGYVGPVFLTTVGLTAAWMVAAGLAVAGGFAFTAWRSGQTESESAAAHVAAEEAAEGPHTLEFPAVDDVEAEPVAEQSDPGSVEDAPEESLGSEDPAGADPLGSDGAADADDSDDSEEADGVDASEEAGDAAAQDDAEIIEGEVVEESEAESAELAEPEAEEAVAEATETPEPPAEGNGEEAAESAEENQQKP